MEKRIVPKSEFIDWLYVLSWHIKDLRKKLAKCSDEEKEFIEAKLEELNELKILVLARFLSSGQGSIRGVHVIKGRKFYCVRVDRENTFHVLMDERIKNSRRKYRNEEIPCEIYTD